MTTKHAKTESSSPSNAAQKQLDDLASWQGSALGAVTHAGQAYVNGLAAINREMASFLQARLRRDIELGESLARCRTLADATEVQNDWLKRTTEDYASETQKLVELGSGLMRESWMPLEQSAASLQAQATKETESHSD